MSMHIINPMSGQSPDQDTNISSYRIELLWMWARNFIIQRR